MPSRRKQPRRPVVALLVETSNAFSRELLHGVRDWMRVHGSLAIHLSEQGRGNQPPPLLRNWQGDGIIARIETPAIAAAVRRTGVPVVNVSAAGLVPEFSAVISDSAGIAALAAEHLLERGFQHFGYCGDARFAWAQRHGENFAAALREAGRDCVVYPTEATDADNWEREQKKLAQWLRALPKPVGVMTCYDIRGQQVLDVSRAQGLRVPDDVAVIGQHNDELLCELCDPPLSSVIPNARRAGYEAAELLTRQLRGRRLAPRILEIPPIGVATRHSTDIMALDDPQLAAAARFIRANACHGIGVPDVLRAVPMSRTLLERRFQERLGRTPHEQIIRCRQEEAKRLLATTDLTLAQIAERTGYNNPEYFSAAFKQAQGLAPGAYRSNTR